MRRAAASTPFRRLVAQGWVDALRTLHPGKRVYIFWKYLRNAFERDAGLRIDHFLLSPPLTARLTDASVDCDVRGREKASDHAPIWITLSGRDEVRPDAPGGFEKSSGTAQRRPRRSMERLQSAAPTPPCR
jgi:hypothetical protein